MSTPFWQVWLGQTTNANPQGSGSDASVNSNVLKQTYINRFLDVSGTFTVRYDASINGNLYLGPNSRLGLGVTAPSFILDQSGTARMQSPNSASYTSSPHASQGNHGLVLTSTKATGGSAYSMGLGIDFISGAGYITTGFNSSGTSATQPLILNATGGDVGIGYINPTAALFVVGNQTITGSVATGANDAAAYYGNTVASFLNSVTSSAGGVSNAATIEIGALNRNILVGTPPTGTVYKYALTTSVIANGSDFEIKGITVGANTGANGTPVSRLYISPAGNVGIGTTSPAYNLDVSGNNRITGNLYMPGSPSIFFANNETISISGLTIPTYGLSWQTDTAFNSGGPTGFITSYGGLKFQTNGATKMAINNAGNVGIGTTSPAQLLDIAVTSGAANIRLCSSASAGYITSSFNAGVNSYVGIHSGANTTAALGTPQFVVSNNNYCGIGTTTPSYPLHITITGGGASGSGGYANNGGSGNSGTWGLGNMQIFLTGSIRIGDAVAYASDNRIKTNIIDIDESTIFTELIKFKPKTFTYKDTVKKGTNKIYGFIAQDVEAILPENITHCEEIIPNIYELADVNANIITLRTKSTSEFTPDPSGNPIEIKCYDGSNKEILCKIMRIIDDKRFEIDNLITESVTFVYGQKIKDFKNINKDDIYTLTTAAVKVLIPMVQTQQNQIQDLQTENAGLKSKNNELEVRLASLEARLSAAGIP